MSQTVADRVPPSAPFPYSTGGQPSNGFDSRERVRSDGQIGTDGSRVLQKGRLGVERNDRISPGRDG